jgi:hypothetical protein
MFTILLLVFGVVALVNGSFKITRNREITDQNAKLSGIILIIGAFTIPLLALIIVFGIGMATSQKIEDVDEFVKAKNTID